MVEAICEHCASAPREMANFCVQIQDYLIATNGEQSEYILDQGTREVFRKRCDLEK